VIFLYQDDLEDLDDEQYEFSEDEEEEEEEEEVEEEEGVSSSDGEQGKKLPAGIRPLHLPTTRQTVPGRYLALLNAQCVFLCGFKAYRYR
jgi:hypothetical protein